MAVSAQTELAIEADGLAKSYGKTRALRGIDLAIRRGSVYGILGPNGAGKTTTIRILTTLIKPTGGSARVLGHDVVREAADVRSKICLTGQHASLDEDLTGQENLVLIARLFGLGWRSARARAAELLAAFDLEEFARRLVRTYSGGLRRRLDIAAGLILIPEIVFLDEPTTGLDPRSRNQVWDIVRTIAAEGTTVLLTTQYMEEADRLADRLAVIDHGRLIADGTSSELKASVGANSVRVRLFDLSDRDRAEQILREQVQLEVHAGSDAFSLVAALDRENQITQAFHSLTGNGLRIADFSVGQPTMDEVFFALTGHPAIDEPEPGHPDGAIKEPGS
ncbi:MAG: ATP-binding cassette domain-containing protein [Spirochaetales bacterium]|nr:ATP-binding cassette domain-containing protein [Leptospiraceae bacterium]MCP5480401.1 ATP-binding cassette domain-containing protein [Spirochaetales bacterium]